MATAAEQFAQAASVAAEAQLDKLRAALDFTGARALRAADAQDIVVAGKEVLLSVYRQIDPPQLEGRVLVTVQVARHGLGGVVNFLLEKGLVFSADAPTRVATEGELAASRGR